MILFWRTTDKYGVFSSFSNHSIRDGDKVYDSGEHRYQAHKASNEEDHEKIRKTKGCKACKSLARSIDLRPDWEEVKFDIMLDTIRLKVAQYEFIKEKLLETGDEEIAEDSPYDAIWGLGPDGKGQNLLGKAWMQVRKELREKK